MKKQIQVILAMIFAICIMTICVNDRVSAKAKKKVIGNFKYQYMVTKEGTWITKITPLSDKGIEILVVPKKLGGKNVIKIGAKGDSSSASEKPNMFGVVYSRNDDGTYEPQEIYDRVEKIKKICLPDTVQEMTWQCFDDIPYGKQINIPKSLVSNQIDNFVFRKWDKLTVSPKNPKYKVKNSCLLSKNGKILYGFVHEQKKITVPKTVVRMAGSFGYEGAKTIILPQSLKKIDGFSTDNYVRIIVAKGNKKFGSEYGCVYDKKTKRLLFAGAYKGVLQIPNKVQYVGEYGNLGKMPKKIICHSRVKELRLSSYYSKLTCVMSGKKTPRLLAKNLLLNELKVFVPKGCKRAYEKEWGNVLSEETSEETKLVIKER